MTQVDAMPPKMRPRLGSWIWLYIVLSLLGAVVLGPEFIPRLGSLSADSFPTVGEYQAEMVTALLFAGLALAMFGSAVCMVINAKWGLQVAQVTLLYLMFMTPVNMGAYGLLMPEKASLLAIVPVPLLTALSALLFFKRWMVAGGGVTLLCFIYLYYKYSFLADMLAVFIISCAYLPYILVFYMFYFAYSPHCVAIKNFYSASLKV